MKRRLIPVRLLLLLLALICLPAAVAATLQIDDSFDNGSIGPYAIDEIDGEIDFSLLTDALNYTYWSHFSVSGVMGRTITFRITNADDVSFLSEPGREAQIVYSYNGDTWHRTTNHGYSGGTYTFTETFTSDVVRIATFFPYSSSQMSALVDQAALSPYATKTVLGTSHEGRDIDLLTITNDLIPTSQKKVIYIVGRQHAAETASSHMLEGMIDFLLLDDVYAAGFRAGYVWHIVPMVNPDGVFLGHSRANAEGNDPNRDWHQNNHDSVEIDMVRGHLDAIDAGDGVDLFVDWHSQMNDTGWYNFVYSPPGNTFFGILSDWTDFDTEKAVGTSCSVSSCSSRGYATGRGLFVFVMEPTPHLVTWTRETLRDEGVKSAFAVNEYFGLFVAPAGAVPNGSETPGVPLMLDHAGGNEITLAWGASCQPADTDYAIYEGAMGSFLSHVPVAAANCSTAGATSATFQPGPGDRYYLVVPQGAEREGSYGTDGNGELRLPSASACRPQLVGACP